MPRKFYTICFMALLVVIPLLYIIINMVDRRIKLKKENLIYIGRQKWKYKNKLIALYHFLLAFPLTKRHLWRVTRRYEILYPGEKKDIYIKSVLFVIKTWSISFIILYFIFIRNPSPYQGAIAILLVWVISAEITRGSTDKITITILKQLDHFLSDIRHFYYINGSVDDAILESIEFAEKEMKIHGHKIYEVLSSDHLEDEVMKYNDSVHNNYLKMFLAQCVSVYDYGDKEVKGESLFLYNIKNLKLDINIEIIKRNKIKFLFMGINAMILIPVLFLDFIRTWAVSNIPELYNFYYGRKGLILMMLIFVFTIILYVMVGYLKEDTPLLNKDYGYLNRISEKPPFMHAIENYKKKNYGKMERIGEELKKMGETITPKQLLVKRWMVMLGTFTAMLVFFIMLHQINRGNILNKMDNGQVMSIVTSQKDKETIVNIMKQLVKEGLKKQYSLEETITKIDGIHNFKNQGLQTQIGQEILNKIEKYKGAYLQWYEVLITIAVSYMAYWFPYWMIVYKKSIRKMNMKDEVIEFQSIILMLIYIDRMTVSKILEFMETFGVIFKDSIRVCINEMDAGDIQALTNLKIREQFKPFQRLVDNFLISDKIGLELAFDEIAVDRVNFTEERKLDHEINITNRGTLAKYLGYFHFILIILCYLTIPFMLECLRQFQLYNNGISGFL